MITRITGVINRVLDDEARLQVGALEYQVLIPEFVRRVLQHKVGQEVSLHTLHYFDGDPSRGKVVPRLVGFQSEAEMEFLELFCTVDKIGVKKALKALARPVRDVADAIQRQDSKWLATLPGIGGPTAEKIVTTLKRKVTRYAIMAAAAAPAGGASSAPAAARNGEAPAAEFTGAAAASVNSAAVAVVVDGNVLEDAYQALIGLGQGPMEARALLDRALGSGKAFASVEEVLIEIFNKK